MLNTIETIMSLITILMGAFLFGCYCQKRFGGNTPTKYYIAVGGIIDEDSYGLTAHFPTGMPSDGSILYIEVKCDHNWQAVPAPDHGEICSKCGEKQ